MKQPKNSRTAILVLVLIGLLFIAYKVIFVSSPTDLLVEDDTAASERVTALVAEVQSINFDLSVLDDPKFMSLKSLDMPALNLPVGKRNPFSSGKN